MPNGLYMSFNQEFSGYHEYPKTIICPSVSYSFWSDTPDISLKVGQTLIWKNLLSETIKDNYNNEDKDSAASETTGTQDEGLSAERGFVITKIHVSDEVIGERNGYPFRQWLITLDGYIQNNTVLTPGEEPAVEAIITKYSVNVEKLENEDTLFTISIETINYGSAPVIKCSIGDTNTSSVFFKDIPAVPTPFTCTNYSYSDAFNELNLHVWTVVYEGFAIVPHEEKTDDDENDLEISTSYELNGSTVYTIDGDIIALRRSEIPIMKKSIMKITDSADRITTPGDTYQGGIVLSESIVKETIKNNNIVSKTYYKHTIEVEGGANTSDSEHEEADG